MSQAHVQPVCDAQPEGRQHLKIVIVGHVDHGKSTLVGRLLADTHSLPEGRLQAIQQSCVRRGMPFEWSFLMDALQTERDQGITIDTTQIWLRTPSRDVVIIDAPGHKEFLKNMITGAAQADAALLLIDAKEGIREQSRRHGYLLHLLGVRQIAVLVNKMDRVEYDEAVFRRIEAEYTAYLESVGVTPSCFIPISARDGDCIAGASAQMPWYRGESVTAMLERFEVAVAADHLPLRFPIQDVYKFDERRILAGRIESGRLRVGDTLVFSPSHARARVASIEAWPGAGPQEAAAGQSVGITLDTQIFVERGQVASLEEKAPVITNYFRARLFWLGHKPLEMEKRYKIKLATAVMMAEIRSIAHVIDADTLAQVKADRVERGQVAEVVFRTRGLVAVDDFNDNPRLGRFVIQQDHDVAGGGIISLEGVFDQRQAQSQTVKSTNIFDVDFGVTGQQRAIMNGHMGGILWLTGLSGSGKSTLARQLQKRLFDKGYHVFALDGDNIRRGLCRDLGFSPSDRKENIRRAGETAALFAQAGTIVICSFISPYREDRRLVRAIAPEYFHNIYVRASLETCEKRDTKGLYRKAREGKIPEFTGISAPYEEPLNPDHVVDTEHTGVQDAVEQLLRYVEHHLVDPVRNMATEGGSDYAGTGI